ncbi:MFS transporter [Brachybacterium endophyticum]|uniref:MFS transporter n=2 Tax=Brachybacterium endophyticum TaxID=2182385 RepID=A0A2U2RNQ5_9MICO|nr:MFS transporter [Brachybacterium endophyticum]
MMLGSILNPINSSIIAVALVPIGVALGAPARETTWLITGLYLATAIGQPLMGRLVDTYGARRMFLVGSALTLLAGLLGTLSPNIWVLVVARVVLGFGTCAGYPSAMRLIREEGERTGVHSPARVLSALSITTQTISVIGPVLGGALIDIGGWRSTLAINVLLGAAGLVLGRLYLPAPQAPGPSAELPSAGRTARARIDVLGIVLFAIGMVSVLLLIMQPSVARLWLLVPGVAAGVAFVVQELRVAAPFIDLRMLRSSPALVRSYLRSVLTALVSYGYMYGFTQWMQESRDLSPSLSGLVLLPTFLVGIGVVALTGRRSDLRKKLLVGSIAQILACALVLVLHDDSPIVLLLAIAVVLGIPQGLVNLANQNAVYVQARPEQVGSAAGLLRTFMYFGAIGSSSASGLLFGDRASTGGMHDLGLVMLVAAIGLLVLSATDRSLRRR